MPVPREEIPLEQPVERATDFPMQPVLTGLDAGLIGVVRPPTGPAHRVTGAVAGRSAVRVKGRRRYWSIRDLSRRLWLGRGYEVLRELVRSGVLPATRSARSWWIDDADVLGLQAVFDDRAGKVRAFGRLDGWLRERCWTLPEGPETLALGRLAGEDGPYAASALRLPLARVRPILPRGAWRAEAAPGGLVYRHRSGIALAAPAAPAGAAGGPPDARGPGAIRRPGAARLSFARGAPTGGRPGLLGRPAPGRSGATAPSSPPPASAAGPSPSGAPAACSSSASASPASSGPASGATGGAGERGARRPPSTSTAARGTSGGLVPAGHQRRPPAAGPPPARPLRGRLAAGRGQARRRALPPRPQRAVRHPRQRRRRPLPRPPAPGRRRTSSGRCTASTAARPASCSSPGTRPPPGPWPASAPPAGCSGTTSPWSPDAPAAAARSTSPSAPIPLTAPGGGPSAEVAPGPAACHRLPGGAHYATASCSTARGPP